jgi:hypothetical protein
MLGRDPLTSNVVDQGQAERRQGAVREGIVWEPAPRQTAEDEAVARQPRRHLHVVAEPNVDDRSSNSSITRRLSST